MKIVTVTGKIQLNEQSAHELVQELRRHGMEVKVKERKAGKKR